MHRHNKFGHQNCSVSKKAALEQGLPAFYVSFHCVLGLAARDQEFHPGKVSIRSRKRHSVSSFPSSSSTASIAGVCVSPVTMTRSGIARLGNFRLCEET